MSAIPPYYVTSVIDSNTLMLATHPLNIPVTASVTTTGSLQVIQPAIINSYASQGTFSVTGGGKTRNCTNFDYTISNLG